MIQSTDSRLADRMRQLSRHPHLRPLAGCLGALSLADLGIWLRPAVTFGLEEGTYLTSREAGATITAEIIAVSMTMLLAAKYMRAIPFRTLALYGFFLSIAMSGLSLVASGLPAVIILRSLTAVGYGILATVSYAAAARLLDPRTGFGLLFALGTALSFVALALLPLLQPMVGAHFAFIGYIIYGLLMAPFLLLLPTDMGFEAASTASEDLQSAELASARWRRILLLSAAFAIHGVAYQGIWSFFYTLAARVGMEAAAISGLLSLATLISVGSSLASAPLTRWFGRNRFIYLGIAVTSAALLAMLHASDAFTLGLAACALMFTLFALYPTVFGLAAQIDPSGRGASFLQGSGMLIGATGPLISGHLFHNKDYLALTLGTLGLCVASILFFIVVLRKVDGEKGTAEQA